MSGNSSNDTFARRTLGRKFYPRVIIDQILDEVRKGRSVVQICENPQFPAASSFYSWCASDSILQAEYQAAQKDGIAARRLTNV